MKAESSTAVLHQQAAVTALRFFLADDLTGALEIAALLEQTGRRVRIGIGRPPVFASTDSVVIDCGTRRATGAATRRRYSELLEALGPRADQLYLKFDSTLRGSIRATIESVLRFYPRASLVFCPAYPALGRTVVNGRVLVNGEPLCARSDADRTLEPVPGCSVIEVLRSPKLEPVSVRNADELRTALRRTPVIACCDAQTEADFRGIWEAVEGAAEPPLLAGSAGLLAVCCHRISAPDTGPLRNRTWIVVCGSMNPVAREQALRSPWPVVYPGREPDGRPLVEQGPAMGLIIFGGDTAAALFASLGVQELEAGGEILPGLPCSWIQAGGRRIPVITKAGGFGPLDVLDRLRHEMNRP